MDSVTDGQAQAFTAIDKNFSRLLAWLADRTLQSAPADATTTPAMVDFGSSVMIVNDGTSMSDDIQQTGLTAASVESSLTLPPELGGPTYMPIGGNTNSTADAKTSSAGCVFWGRVLLLAISII